jgi:hypothetical protein
MSVREKTCEPVVEKKKDISPEVKEWLEGLHARRQV